MKSKSKRSQITIFLIIGVVMIMVVVSLLLLTRYAAKKTSKQEILDVKEAAFDIQPINNFVTECLSLVSQDALKKLGSQGGRLYISQGGPVPDYLDGQEGFLFINHEDSKVAYNLVRPQYTLGKYKPDVPDYPWKTFPYTDESKNEQTFDVENVFGINKLPPLNKSFTQQPMQEQLAVYVRNNIDSCLDFSIFSEQGFDISKKEKNVTVDMNENDVVFKMIYPLIVENLVSGEKTEIKNFLIRHKVRLGKLHRFLNKLIQDDISDIEFDISRGSKENFNVNVQRDIFENDDLITVVDQGSLLENLPYKYIFARKNRNPSLFYLSPGEVFVPAFDANGEFTTITQETILAGQQLSASDPDEDTINQNSFSITPAIPITLTFPSITFKVQVTDGAIEDYQEIIVRRE